MEKEKSKRGVIISLVIIILMLVALVILLLTGIINFKNNSNESVSNINSSNGSIGENVEYYQFYKEYEDNTYTAYELGLLQDGNVKYCVVKANSGSFCSEGKYTTDKEKIIFNGKYTTGVSVGQNISITFIKENDKIYEELSKVYPMTKTSKENLKILFSNISNDSTNKVLFPVENGYTEVALSASQRKEINDKLLVFNVDYSSSMFPNYHNADIGDDLYSSDCTKVGVAFGYVFDKIKGRKTDNKYSIDGYYQKNGNDYTFNIKKIKSLAGIFFNKDIVCNEEPYDKDFTFHDTGGGWASYYLKTVSKYKNGNNYYLILHLINGPLNCLQNDNCYEIDDDPTIDGNYFKLKYYKDNNKEYIISLEYLK